MNNKFKILWFEDEVTWYRMELLRIVAILKEHSLIPEIVRREGDEYDLSELFGNDFDLIFMDFKLAEGATGDRIVAAIRKNDILTDILFYSSEEKNMLDAIYKSMPPIDGVYLTKRDYTIFTEKAERLINKIVKRSEDVVNLRGFVLDNTSDFELRIKEILNICWNKFSTDQRTIMINVTNRLLEGKRARTTKQVEIAKESDNVFTFTNNDEYLFSVSDRLDIVQEILPLLFDIYMLPKDICPGNFKEYYIKKVNMFRNRLGHLKFGERKLHIQGKDVMIDQNFHRLLRENISEVDDTINELEKYITESI